MKPICKPLLRLVIAALQGYIFASANAPVRCAVPQRRRCTDVSMLNTSTHVQSSARRDAYQHFGFLLHSTRFEYLPQTELQDADVLWSRQYGDSATAFADFAKAAPHLMMEQGGVSADERLRLLTVLEDHGFAPPVGADDGYRLASADGENLRFWFPPLRIEDQHASVPVVSCFPVQLVVNQLRSMHLELVISLLEKAELALVATRGNSARVWQTQPERHVLNRWPDAQALLNVESLRDWLYGHAKLPVPGRAAPAAPAV